MYVISRLSGKALTLVSPRLNQANRHAYQTVAELYAHLAELYGDPNKEWNARQAFKDLTMKKTDTFQEFYAEFLRHVANGNISPRDLKGELNDKLTWKLQELVGVYYMDPAVTTTQFAQYCTTVDQLHRSRIEKRGPNQRKPESVTTAKPAKSVFQPRALVTERPVEPAQRALPRQPPGLKCYNCFETGHMSKDCPRPQTARTKQILAAKIAQVSGEQDADGGSGKE